MNRTPFLVSGPAQDRWLVERSGSLNRGRRGCDEVAGLKSTIVWRPELDASLNGLCEEIALASLRLVVDLHIHVFEDLRVEASIENSRVALTTGAIDRQGSDAGRL